MFARNSALCSQYLFFQEDKILQKEIVVAQTAFKENPECKLEEKDMLRLSLSHTASNWLKKIVKSHDGLCTFLYKRKSKLWLFLNHFKEPYALPDHSILSETQFYIALGGRQSTQFKTHRIIFVCFRVLLHYKINFVYIIIVVTFHVD